AARRADAARVLFIGGRAEDHNTRERIEGFRQAHERRGLATKPTDIVPCDYAAEKAQAALGAYVEREGHLPAAMFVNSTISLEGIVRWLRLGGHDMNDIIMGCFDWDPLAAAFHPRLIMMRQDVSTMIARLFDWIDTPPEDPTMRLEVMPEIIGHSAAVPGRG
ncbi:MAG: LacI family transcriptional regulator, partial [Salinicola sp.]|nr:LacI family transcriptional regulator [Salinicola sp.]